MGICRLDIPVARQDFTATRAAPLPDMPRWCLVQHNCGRVPLLTRNGAHYALLRAMLENSWNARK